MYIPEYKLLGLYNIISMYVFRDDYLVLDNQLVCSSLGETVSLAPDFLSCL